MNKHYVYKHHALINNVNYVFFGIGSHNAYRSKKSKTQLHIDLWDNLNKAILVNELKIEDAIVLANGLISSFVTDENNYLLNKRLIPVVNEIEYEIIKGRLKIDVNSPSGLTWISGQDSGKFAGSLGKDGYFRLRINDKNYLCHRLLYSLFYRINLSPKLQIDHVNRNKKDNSIHNLRLVSPKENIKNRYTKIGKSGIRNINFDEKRERWIARWYDGTKGCSKIFNPRSLFPGDEDAVEKAKQAAIDFINNKMKELL